MGLGKVIWSRVKLEKRSWVLLCYLSSEGDEGPVEEAQKDVQKNVASKRQAEKKVFNRERIINSDIPAFIALAGDFIRNLTERFFFKDLFFSSNMMCRVLCLS